MGFLKAEEYAKQLLDTFDEYMKKSDVFYAQLNSVKIPFAIWYKASKIVNETLKGYGYPYHNHNTGEGWLLWKNSGSNVAQRMIAEKSYGGQAL